MRSSWDETKIKSKYHFNVDKIDPNYDTVVKMGKFTYDFSEEVAKIVKNAKPATWATRGYKGKGVEIPPDDLGAEENDLIRAGVDPNMVITHLNWDLPQMLQQISDLFGLKDCMNRVHVQMPGEVWNLHLDKLHKWNPDNPYTIKRIMVHLTDWQPGHFWSYGNYTHQGWKAGEITTFDWHNVPHSTANAGHTPRVTFQMTGVVTEKYNDFTARLKRFGTHVLKYDDSVI